MTRMEPMLDQPRKPHRRKPRGWLAGGLTVLTVCAASQLCERPAARAEGPVLKIFGKKADKPAKKSTADQEPGSSEPMTAAPDKLLIVARINGQDISRNELGKECLAHFGDEVLKTLVNKQLIVEHCKAARSPSRIEEVQDEINRMAERFGLPTDQLLKMLKEERHISPAQYAKEIIWPTVALRKLAEDRLTVSEKEFKQAWDMLYGPAVQARLIACRTPTEAEKVWKLALQRPDDFGQPGQEVLRPTECASAKG